MSDIRREITVEMARLAASAEYREAQKVWAGPRQIKQAKKMLARARKLTQIEVGDLVRVVSDWASKESRILCLVMELYRAAQHQRADE